MRQALSLRLGRRRSWTQECKVAVLRHARVGDGLLPFPLPPSPFPDPMQRRCMTRQEARLGLDHLSAMGACTCGSIAKSLWNMLRSKSLRFADSTQLSQQLRSKRSLAPSMNRASSSTGSACAAVRDRSFALAVSRALSAHQGSNASNEETHSVLVGEAEGVRPLLLAVPLRLAPPAAYVVVANHILAVLVVESVAAGLLVFILPQSSSKVAD